MDPKDVKPTQALGALEARIIAREVDGDEIWLNAYIISREYGGPQEGGWWWNRRSCIHSEAAIQVKMWDFSEDTDEGVPNPEALHDALARLCDRYRDLAWGDINSVNGGRDIEVLAEAKRAETESANRPMYE